MGVVFIYLRSWGDDISMIPLLHCCYFAVSINIEPKSLNLYYLLAHIVSRQAHKVSLQYTHAPASTLRPSVVYCPPSTFFKHLLLQHRLTNQSQISCGASMKRGTAVCINGPVHMTKMTTTPVNDLNI